MTRWCAAAVFIPPLKGEGGSERSEEPGGVLWHLSHPPVRSLTLAATLPRKRRRDKGEAND